MNTFAIYTNIILTEKPEWLEEFKNKHNQIKYDDHITLIQPRKVTEREIDEIKTILTSFFKDQTCKQISLTFDRIDIDETGVEENDGCILVLTDNQHVIDLQKALLGLLSEYKEYLTPKTEVYEKDFRPHITIVDNLNKERFQLAKADLSGDIVIKGIIAKVILGVVCKGEKQEFVFGLQV
jgi:2'-5' RNA ligase